MVDVIESKNHATARSPANLAIIYICHLFNQKSISSQRQPEEKIYI